MEAALLTTQLLLAAIFLATGLTKLSQPRAQLAAGPMGWAADVTDLEFRTVGLLEVLGALGLVLPGALGIAPLLTPLAAVGLAMTMIGAIVTHVRMGETDRLAVPLVLLAPRCSSRSRASVTHDEAAHEETPRQRGGGCGNHSPAARRRPACRCGRPSTRSSCRRTR